DQRVALAVLSHELPDAALQVPALHPTADLHLSLSGTTTARPAHQAMKEPSSSQKGTIQSGKMGRYTLRTSAAWRSSPAQPNARPAANPRSGFTPRATSARASGGTALQPMNPTAEAVKPIPARPKKCCPRAGGDSASSPRPGSRAAPRGARSVYAPA